MRLFPALAFVHRWLGIAGAWLFLVWFASGIVMIYARMPALDPGERLRRLPDLDFDSATVTPAEAAHAVGLGPDRLRIGMLGDRPVYRFAEGPRWTTVFADDGRPLESLPHEQALEIASGFAPEHAATTHAAGALSEPDQWTLQSRALLPMHEIDLGDAARSVLYVSQRTGEPVLETRRSSRLAGYAGPVLHWLYFTPLRRHGSLWARLVFWLAVAGSAISLSGLALGLWRFSLRRRYRLGGTTRRSPYSGWVRWHHYAGLVFGTVTFTWVFSGALSLEPWDWQPGTSPTVAQTTGAAGGALRLDAFDLPAIRTATVALESSFPVKELDAIQLLGAPYLLAHRAPAPERPRGRLTSPNAFLSPVQPFEHRLVSLAVGPSALVLERLDDSILMAAAAAAMPGAEIVTADLLTAHDAYYYDREDPRPLPILRVRYSDPADTALYFDPSRGLIVHREERLTRVNRWLYHGLHSLDLPGLYGRRPTWDLVVILLSLGGLALAATTLVPGWRRLTARRRGPP